MSISDDDFSFSGEGNFMEEEYGVQKIPKKRGGKKRKANKIIQITQSTSVFPTEIILDIISRLPFDQIVECCSYVCKTWHNLIYTPSLGQALHLPNQSNTVAAAGDDGKVSFLFMTESESSHLYYGDIDLSKDSYSCLDLKMISHPKIYMKRDGMDAFVGSCNGLVCFSVPGKHEMNDPIYICNPITREHTYLPKFFKMARYKNNVEYKKTNFTDGCIVSGFGYLPNTNEYKVVRIFYEENPRRSDQTKGLVQVYTLGSGSGWRAKGEITYSLQHFGLSIAHLHCSLKGTFGSPPPSRAILANGALHWLDNEGRIVAFDLADEMFRLIPSPPCLILSGKNIYQLHVLSGCLCLLHEKEGVSLDMWSFKKESCEWERMFSISHQTQNKLVLSMMSHQEGKLVDDWWPVSVTSSGKVLFRNNQETLISYDPQTATLTKHVEIASDMLGYSDPLLHAIPHTHSFVSLKTLGEKSEIRKRLDYDENPLFF